MQLISKLAIFAGGVSGISALYATYAYSQSTSPIETKKEEKEINKENSLAPGAQEKQVPEAQVELTAEEQEDFEMLQEVL